MVARLHEPPLLSFGSQGVRKGPCVIPMPCLTSTLRLHMDLPRPIGHGVTWLHYSRLDLAAQLAEGLIKLRFVTDYHVCVFVP